MNNGAIIWGIVENIITLLCMTGLILGLYYMGAGGWAALPMLLVFNLSSVRITNTYKSGKQE